MKHKKSIHAFFKKHKKIGRPKGSRDKKPRKRRMGNKKWATKAAKAVKKTKPCKHKHIEILPHITSLKSYKFLGYCKCDTIISTKDLISKLIYVCPICDKKARIKTLKEALNLTRIDRRDDKDEIHHYVDTLPLNDNTIDPRDFKVI